MVGRQVPQSGPVVVEPSGEGPELLLIPGPPAPLAGDERRLLPPVVAQVGLSSAGQRLPIPPLTLGTGEGPPGVEPPTDHTPTDNRLPAPSVPSIPFPSPGPYTFFLPSHVPPSLPSSVHSDVPQGTLRSPVPLPSLQDSLLPRVESEVSSTKGESTPSFWGRRDTARRPKRGLESSRSGPLTSLETDLLLPRQREVPTPRVAPTPSRGPLSRRLRRTRTRDLEDSGGPRHNERLLYTRSLFSFSVLK